MRGEKFIQYAAALGIIVLWGVLQLLDARSQTYSAPAGVTYIAFTAAGFVFGFDKVAGFVAAARRAAAGQQSPPVSPPDKEPKPDE